MARKKSSNWSTLTFNALSPARILLMVSVLVNVGLAAVIIVWNSRDYDTSAYANAVDHICNRDYDFVLSNADSAEQSDIHQLCGDTVRK